MLIFFKSQINLTTLYKPTPHLQKKEKKEKKVNNL